jgi:hypothetical protein
LIVTRNILQFMHYIRKSALDINTFLYPFLSLQNPKNSKLISNFTPKYTQKCLKNIPVL